MAIRSEFPTYLDNVWIYLRKSREDSEAEERARREGREDVETLARHRRALFDFARRFNHNITTVLEEVVSGEYISERPQMLRLLDAVDNNEVGAVLVMELDRLGRGDMADQGRILRSFKDSGTLILTPDKIYDLNDEMDEEWTEFKTFFARRELKMITKRMQRGRVASVQEGKFIGTRPPFGYDVNRDLILVPNEDADTVRMIFDLYVNKGMGCNRIATYLNSIGISSPLGKAWRGESVIALIRKPVYAGDIVWRRVKVDKRRGTFKQRPEDEQIRAKGKHEPIVDEVTFQRSIQIRSGRTHAPVRRDRSVSSSLSGLIECSMCGQKMIKRPYTKQAAHLICKNPSCPQKSTRLSLVEEGLLHALQAWLHEYRLTFEEMNEDVTDDATPILDHEKIIKSFDQEIQRVEQQRDKLADLLEREIYDEATYLHRNQKLLEELSDLRHKKQLAEDEFRKESESRQAQHSVIPNVISVLESYRQTDDVVQQNKLLRSILIKVVYNKEKWQRGDQFKLQLFPHDIEENATDNI